MAAAGAIVIAGLVGSAPVAHAAEGDSLPVSQFAAPLCEGTTRHDPTVASGPVRDLTQVFGKRLEAYNNGDPVMVYSVDGANSGSTPNCVTQYVPGEGAVSNWVYCVDRASDPCSRTEADGSLSQDFRGRHFPVGPLQPKAENDRLSGDQAKLVTYLLSTDLPLSTPLPDALRPIRPVASVASDASDSSREARQWLVWCVTDREILPAPPFFDVDLPRWCDENFGPDARDAVLTRMPDEPELVVTPREEAVVAGDQALVSLTTNLYDQPLAISAPSGTVEICADDESGAVLEDHELTVPAAAAGGTTDVPLCVTRADAGTVEVTASSHSLTTKTIGWSQSDSATDEFTCQVYASAPDESDEVVSAAAVTFADPSEGDGGNGTGGPGDPGDGDPGDDGTSDSGTGDSSVDQGTAEGGQTAGERGDLATTGGELPPLIPLVAFALIGAGTAATVAGMRHRRKLDAGMPNRR